MSHCPTVQTLTQLEREVFDYLEAIPNKDEIGNAVSIGSQAAWTSEEFDINYSLAKAIVEKWISLKQPS